MTALSTMDEMRLLMGGHYLARCIHVVAELGVADALGDAPKPAAALAQAVGADPDSLARVLRLLSAHGVFAQRGETFVHSELSQLLRSDHPKSLRPWARMTGSALSWSTWANFLDCVRTGKPAPVDIAPEGRWAYFAENPSEAGAFDEAMTAKSHEAIKAVLAAYDFSSFQTIGDIGGGRGHLISAILEAAPQARGVLVDQPHVLERIGGAASDRLTLQGGDFFKDALPVCDCYVMMDVLHDWDDAKAAQILAAVRRAAPSGAKLLVLEDLVSDDPGPSYTKMMDLVMMAAFSGRQRTPDEFAALYAKAGFRLTRVIATGAGMSIVEGV